MEIEPNGTSHVDSCTRKQILAEPGVVSSLTKWKHPLERSEVSLPTNVVNPYCIFCGEETGHSDHSFMKTCLSDDIKHKAETLGHNPIIHALAAGGDLISIEVRYYRHCYTRFNSYYDRFITSELPLEDDLETTIDEEIYQTIREEVADGRKILKILRQ